MSQCSTDKSQRTPQQSTNPNLNTPLSNIKEIQKPPSNSRQPITHSKRSSTRLFFPPTPDDESDVGTMRAGCSAGQLLSLVGGDKASDDTRELAIKLLSGETLDEENAYRLGKRIFDVQQPSTVLW